MQDELRTRCLQTPQRWEGDVAVQFVEIDTDKPDCVALKADKRRGLVGGEFRLEPWRNACVDSKFARAWILRDVVKKEEEE